MRITIRLSRIIWGLFFVFCVNCELCAADPSLLVHLDFDEDFSSSFMVQDVTGNGHDGWCFNPTNWITPTPGVFGGTGGYWQTNSTLLEPPSTYIPVSQYFGITNLSGIQFLTNATISIWVQFRHNDSEVLWVISNGYDAQYLYDHSGTNGWDFAKYYSSSMRFLIYPVGGGVNPVLTWPTPTDANYHLYTATVDCNANVAVAYYDGLPVQTNTVDVPFLQIYGCPSPRWLGIGKSIHEMPPGPLAYNGDYASGFFEGRMDDFRIYNRVLSATEAQSLYIVYAPNLIVAMANQQSVQLRWDTLSNAVYQVEYVSNMTATAWSALGSAIAGSVTNSITDQVLDPSRFYRVRVLPQ